MRYLPIHLDLEGKSVLVGGGGRAAEAKLRTLIKTTAQITVFARSPSAEIQKWADENRFRLIAGDAISTEFLDASLVYAAYESPTENAKFIAMAEEAGALINAADDKDNCSFISPAIVDRSPVTVSIGTEGTAPGLARAIKGDIERRLPSTLGNFARAVKQVRDKLASRLDIAARQRLWGRVFANHSLDGLSSLDATAIEELANVAMSADQAGSVSLVGAGPGDPDYLTVGALRRLSAADVIVYDRLVSDEVLALGRREAEYIYVGKTPGGASTPQNTINQILIKKARAGLYVVRLKSGDPLIFGRADEELNALGCAGIDAEICPGITSAAAAASEIGQSLTARGQNKAVTFLTGHDAKGYAEQDWQKLAAKNTRAAIYMGLGAARFIQGRLLLHGANANTPVTIVENASRADQIIAESTIGTLTDDIAAHGIKGPALLMLGYSRRRVINQIKAAS